MYKKSFIKTIFVLATLTLQATPQAQCAMCRAVLESEDGGQKAAAVNDGIVYLMAFPYILVAIVGYFIYKSRKPKSAQ